MFKKVLVPTDGSPASTAALKHAIALAKAFGGSITAVSLFDPYPMIGAGPDYAVAQSQYLDAAKVEANKAIAEAQALAAAEGVAAETRVIEAQRTWRGIIDAADTLHADAIVMGSHGRTGLDKLVMGSVTQRVMQHTHLPVLVVRD